MNHAQQGITGSGTPLTSTVVGSRTQVVTGKTVLLGLEVNMGTGGVVGIVKPGGRSGRLEIGVVVEDPE